MPLIIEVDLDLVKPILSRLVQFVCIALTVFFTFRIARRKATTTLYPGIWILAVVLAASAVYDLLTFVDYDYHRQIFSQLSDQLFHLRFSTSIFMRAALIIIGFGLIGAKNWARLGAIYFGLFTVATIYWKHPYYVFENVAFMIEQQNTSSKITELQYPAFPWICMFVYIVVDLVLAGIYIYYFNLKSVVQKFQHERTAS